MVPGIMVMPQNGLFPLRDQPLRCRSTYASGCPRTIWHSWCWTRWPRWIWASSAAVHLSRRRCDLARLAADAAESLAGRFEAADITLERRLTAAGIIADPRWPAAGHAGCLGPAAAPRGARCPGTRYPQLDALNAWTTGRPGAC